MKIAIIGAGFAGLSTAYFLQEHPDIEITLFDKGGVGAGASSVCSGLLHPYPGLNARRSRHGFEAMQLAKKLLRVSEKHTPKLVYSGGGLFREAMTEQQRAMLSSHAIEHQDVEEMSRNQFLIHSGITVQSAHYLEGLFRAIEGRGAKLQLQEVFDLEELQEYDQIVIAAGYGVKTFKECAHLNVKFLKGQALELYGQAPFQRSYISKGYIARMPKEDTFFLGSTYEREFSDDKPDIDVAKELLKHNLEKCPNSEILRCKAAVRVCNRSDYAPIVEKVSPNAHCFTALGSRGLLYHGFFGKKLADTLLLGVNSST